MVLNPNPNPILDPESEGRPNLTDRAPGYPLISWARRSILCSEGGMHLLTDGVRFFKIGDLDIVRP